MYYCIGPQRLDSRVNPELTTDGQYDLPKGVLFLIYFVLPNVALLTPEEVHVIIYHAKVLLPCFSLIRRSTKGTEKNAIVLPPKIQLKQRSTTDISKYFSPYI